MPMPMRPMRPFTPTLSFSDPSPEDAARVGDYYHTETWLYRVEYVSADHALVEDCRHGTLIDVPLVRSHTVAAVLAEWRRTRAPIVRPAHGERHGHPVVFDRAVFADLRAADLNVGAKAVFATYAARIVNVDVNDAGAFIDIDTPEEYQRVMRTKGLEGLRA